MTISILRTCTCTCTSRFSLRVYLVTLHLADIHVYHNLFNNNICTCVSVCDYIVTFTRSSGSWAYWWAGSEVAEDSPSFEGGNVPHHWAGSLLHQPRKWNQVDPSYVFLLILWYNNNIIVMCKINVHFPNVFWKADLHVAVASCTSTIKLSTENLRFFRIYLWMCYGLHINRVMIVDVFFSLCSYWTRLCWIHLKAVSSTETCCPGSGELEGYVPVILPCLNTRYNSILGSFHNVNGMFLWYLLQ